jgi:hypothetical protein
LVGEYTEEIELLAPRVTAPIALAAAGIGEGWQFDRLFLGEIGLVTALSRYFNCGSVLLLASLGLGNKSEGVRAFSTPKSISCNNPLVVGRDNSFSWKLFGLVNRSDSS